MEGACTLKTRTLAKRHIAVVHSTEQLPRRRRRRKAVAAHLELAEAAKRAAEGARATGGEEALPGTCASLRGTDLNSVSYRGFRAVTPVESRLVTERHVPRNS